MKNTNLEKIDAWYETVKGEKELSVNEAKELNNKIKEEPLNKQKLKEELVIGTLYVIRDFIKNLNFIELLDGAYDIDDLISSCCEVWIENIEENIDKKRSFSKMFDCRFFAKLNNKLDINEKHVVYKYTKDMEKNTFDSIFCDFFQNKKKSETITYEQFLDIVKKYIYVRREDINSEEKKEIYNFLNECYELYEIYGNNNITSSKEYIIFLRDLVFEKKVNKYENIENVAYTMEMCKHVAKNELKRDLKKAISELTVEEQIVLTERFGFGDADSEPKTLEEIVKIMKGNWTREKVLRREGHALRKLRRKKDTFTDYV